MKIIEVIKYDGNSYKHPLVFAISIVIFFLKLLGKHRIAYKLAGSIFRFGWKGSDILALKTVDYYFIKNKQLGVSIALEEINSLQPENNTKRFYSHPDHMVGKIITILASPRGGRKGALIINYSIYFALFARFFDVRAISERYHIILEPSWAGLCELSIFFYTSLDTPVFVQAYERRDYELIEKSGTNLVPINIGPSWFINHEAFVPQKSDKIYDVVMVAAWAEFKRHKAFFKAIKPCCDANPKFRIALVGYPVDLTIEDIKSAARSIGIESNICFFESVPREKVAKIQSQSKINVLWSKFEGNNRAIIEGMFCDIPVILREGHNYGAKYDFINEKTGAYANEKNLPMVIQGLKRKLSSLSPRDYVMETRNAIMATRIIETAIANSVLNDELACGYELAVKTNELSGMNYLYLDANSFNEDRRNLSQFIRKTCADL
ncbi:MULTISPECIES: glycosyltransferase [unclassified Alteromonas]|uniref:glycosyltransferase n=1 Tax=unclassified Alteromonas TaxID=2614992 RepID=UPI000509A2E8|nr:MULTISPECIES: glycosyltransferase [unclassified Alteromonas]